MKSWKDMAEEVASHLPGCPAPLAETAAREAVERFCLESHAWTESIDLDPPSDGDPLIVFPPSAHAEAIAIESATQERRPVGNLSFTPPEELRGDFRKDITVDLTIVLKPSPHGYGIPDHLWSYWGRPIRHGALAYLLELPERQWTSLEGAQFYWRRFERGVGDARIRRAKKHAAQETRVKPRSFFFN